MNSVELIKKICKERNIPISRLERELGYGNGYISQLRKGTLPSDRAVEIAGYLSIDLQYLLCGGESIVKKEEPNTTMSVELTNKDKRDIGKALDEIMAGIEGGEDGPLYYNGIEVNPESVGFLKKAIEFALTETKKENKVKYNPNKNKK